MFKNRMQGVPRSNARIMIYSDNLLQRIMASFPYPTLGGALDGSVASSNIRANSNTELTNVTLGDQHSILMHMV